MSNFNTYLQRMQNTKTKLNELKFKKELEKEAKDEENNIDASKLIQLISDNKNKLETAVDDLTQNLTVQLKAMNPDKAIKLLEWMNTWEFYIDTEDDFDLTKRRTYDRGDIVHTNFGFNIGNELGGSHYAVVVEGNNAQKNGTIVVVPLKSTESDDPNDLEISEIFLGKGIIPVGEAKKHNTIAKVGQLKAISKMRILKPTNSRQPIYPTDTTIRSDMLNKLDNKIKELYMKHEQKVEGDSEKGRTYEK